MAKKEEIKIRNVILIGVVLIGIVLFAYLLLRLPLRVEKFEVYFEVGDSLGLNTDGLNFGTVFPGASLERNLVVSNSNTFPVRVDVLVSEEIKDFVFLKKSFIIEPRSEKKISVNLIVSNDSEKGVYGGDIKLVFRDS